MHCKVCSAYLFEQNHDPGHIKGFWAEQFVLDALQRWDHPLVAGARRATFKEDQAGTDVFLKLRNNLIKEIPIQVKAGKSGKSKTRDHTRITIRVLTKTQRQIQNEIASKLPSKLRHLVSNKRFRPQSFVIGDVLCVF